jgi:hypothetical protein
LYRQRIGPFFGPFAVLILAPLIQPFLDDVGEPGSVQTPFLVGTVLKHFIPEGSIVPTTQRIEPARLCVTASVQWQSAWLADIIPTTQRIEPKRTILW